MTSCLSTCPYRMPFALFLGAALLFVIAAEAKTAVSLGFVAPTLPSNRWVSRPSSASARHSGIIPSMKAKVPSGPPRIIISGAPASGKGTQCALLKDTYGLVHLSTGDMLRAAVQDETPVGLAAKGYMEAGKLVPDDIIIGVVKERLSCKDCDEKGWLLDGFPRTRAQADALADAGIQADSFVLLEVPDEVLIERVVGRRLDPETGDIYHTTFNPPSPEIEGRLIQRADDTEEKARVRLDQYHANVGAVMDAYTSICKVIDGTRAKDAVLADIKAGMEVRGGGSVSVEPTTPIEGMKPGTSGLRKKVKVWQEGNYLHNFVQCIFDAFPAEELKGSTIIVSGDGRYYNREAIQVITRIAAANGVGKLWIGKGGLMSTPAVSAVIRERNNGEAYAGLVLTASHNPGGPNEDFGIKFNTQSGSPATETLTDLTYEKTLEITSYKIVKDTPDIDLDVVGSTTVGDMVVEVIDPVEDYVALLRSVFDFPKIKAFLQRNDFSFLFDGMYGVSGPYAKRVLMEELGASEASLLRCEARDDFGGGHPDPNLFYAADLVGKMGMSVSGDALDEKEYPSPPAFGAAADGDADRNMILGRRFFVTPSDSLAVLTANSDAIPYFAKAGGIKGAARSMPSSGALDRVAEKEGIPMFETPTGWKFFGNLMDAKELGHSTSYHPFICGEESFGTGSDHVREKDGLWAVLAWLSVLAHKNQDPSQPLTEVKDIVEAHWAKYGRNYYCRYDYEGVESAGAEAMMEALRTPGVVKSGEQMGSYEVESIDDFSYTDPVDGSVSAKQGIRLLFKGGSRVVFRLSGTGSVGATVRMYVERFEPDVSKQKEVAASVLKELADIGIKVSKIQQFTGRDAPTLIT
ncbi:unnamed protein product [Chrysoparadoxa australica]